MNNVDIRKKIRVEGLTHWQVADCYGLHESNFSRLLRKELDEEGKKRVFRAIDKAKEKYL